jgi:TetR/AcrR family transcriptional repressor of nem operon
LLGYVDFRASILSGELSEYTCLLGTLVQETYDTHPDIRDSCNRSMSAHIAEMTRDVALAKQLYCPTANWTADSIGYFIQSVLLVKVRRMHPADLADFRRSARIRAGTKC